MTVFAGDEGLGLGPDEESIEIWREIGVPDERIVRLPASDNFWQAGATGPCGPCSEMYIDRGPEFGSDDLRPGDDTDRYLEYWNHVFMTYELREDGSLTDLPQRNIDTGLGLERMAVIQQGVDSVFDTDAFTPLIALAEELSGAAYGSDPKVTRAMRIIADHMRGVGQPDRRRRRSLERGPRLRAAADHAARDPAGPGARARAPVSRPLRRAGDRADVGCVSAPRGRARQRHALGRRRGGELRAHARPRHRPAGEAGRRGEGCEHLLDRRRGRLPAARHLRLSVRPDQGAARRAGALGRRRGLRGADGAAAHERPEPAARTRRRTATRR